MASKNLGAVIQRAISDGAFRRQLQSDPAAALRGFNLTPDEIAAVRSGDSSRLLSLGVDSRMSKAFALGATGATRSAMSGDVSGSTSNVQISDTGSGAREGLAGDPTSGARAATSGGQLQDTPRVIADPDNTSGATDAHSSGALSGTRASVTTPQGDAYRAVNDPDSSGANRATVGDPTQAGARSSLTDGQADSYRAVNDPDNTGGTREVQTSAGDSGPGNANIMADENYSVASRMHDAGVALPGSDVQHDPGFIDSTHSAFIPSDSADVQRELLDAQHGTGGGDALGHTGDTTDEHSWG